MIKVGMVSLGCPKNRVDAEIMLKKLQNAGCEITPEEAEADVIIVNTCGFIEDAKAEAIENILEAANYKKDGKCKALIVTGCLAERYRDEIKAELPEVDVTVGLAGNNDIVEIVQKAYEGVCENRYGAKEDLEIEGERLLTTPPYTSRLPRVVTTVAPTVQSPKSADGSEVARWWIFCLKSVILSSRVLRKSSLLHRTPPVTARIFTARRSWQRF